MGIYVGDTEIKGIYLGDTPVKEVYLGDTKVRPSGVQPGVNIFTPDEFTSQAMQEWIEWISSEGGDLSTLSYVLTTQVYNAIEYQYNQITGEDFANDNVAAFGTITGENGGVISSTSSPIITDMDISRLMLCLPIDDFGDIIEDTQYIYENSNYDTGFSLTQYQVWNSLGAVAVDIINLSA